MLHFQNVSEFLTNKCHVRLYSLIATGLMLNSYYTVGLLFQPLMVTLQWICYLIISVVYTFACSISDMIKSVMMMMTMMVLPGTGRLVKKNSRVQVVLLERGRRSYRRTEDRRCLARSSIHQQSATSSSHIIIIIIITVVLHVQNALYFRQKVRTLYYVNALHVFLGFSFP